MRSKPHNIKVFLCHASEDKNVARDLYRLLTDKGFQPWLDEVSLLPGQDWNREILKALRSCEVVIVCLSRNSLSKEGYVQKEIKLALDAALEKPEGTIFVIPVRIEDCDIPISLANLQYVDIFKEKGVDQLILALKSRVGSTKCQRRNKLDLPKLYKPIEPMLSDRMRRYITGLGLRQDIAKEVKLVLSNKNYPQIMSLTGRLVRNPVWKFIPYEEQIKLTSSFRPETETCPVLMGLDIFLIRTTDSTGCPRLLTCFDQRANFGWNAFLLPFRRRTRREGFEERYSKDRKEVAAYLGIPVDSVLVSGLGKEYLISVKPHPSHSELYAYVFEFCAVKLLSPPQWLLNLNCQLRQGRHTRQFSWFHPEELEHNDTGIRVNGDVIRAIFHFFSTTIPEIPDSMPNDFHLKG